MHRYLKRMNRSAVYAAAFSIIASGAFAEEENTALHISDVLQTAALFYPDILAARDALDIAAANADNARGAFDATVSQTLYTRPAGYYDSTLSDTRIEKPLGDFNANISTGYRISDGLFPVYEDEYVTNGGGEYYIGAKISLLRNRTTDKKRTGVTLADLERERQTVKNLTEKLKIQKSASIAYWTWAAEGRKYRAYKDLHDMAVQRQKNIEKKISSGAIADIYGQENKRYLLKRKADMNTAAARLDITASMLSLYYRDGTGLPLSPSAEALPERLPSPEYAFSPEEIIDILAQHPVFADINLKRTALAEKSALADNNMLPVVDMNIKGSRDFGNGSVTRESTELSVMLDVSMPLNRISAKADRKRINAEMRALNREEQMQTDALRVRINTILIDMRNKMDVISITEEEYDIAGELAEAEKKRLDAGISDFFTMNQREEEMINVRIKRIDAQKDYLKGIADMKALTAFLEEEFR